jgi:hypothetical protein
MSVSSSGGEELEDLGADGPPVVAVNSLTSSSGGTVVPPRAKVVRAADNGGDGEARGGSDTLVTAGGLWASMLRWFAAFRTAPRRTQAAIAFSWLGNAAILAMTLYAVNSFLEFWESSSAQGDEVVVFLPPGSWRFLLDNMELEPEEGASRVPSKLAPGESIEFHPSRGLDVDDTLKGVLAASLFFDLLGAFIFGTVLLASMMRCAWCIRFRQLEQAVRYHTIMLRVDCALWAISVSLVVASIVVGTVLTTNGSRGSSRNAVVKVYSEKQAAPGTAVPEAMEFYVTSLKTDPDNARLDDPSAHEKDRFFNFRNIISNWTFSTQNACQVALNDLNDRDSNKEDLRTNPHQATSDGKARDLDYSEYRSVCQKLPGQIVGACLSPQPAIFFNCTGALRVIDGTAVDTIEDLIEGEVVQAFVIDGPVAILDLLVVLIDAIWVTGVLALPCLRSKAVVAV